MNKIKNDYGMKDYYNFYKNLSDNPVDPGMFNKIVSEYNKEIVEHIINKGLEFTPKKLQMTFCIRKTKRVPRIDSEGNLINTTPIDFKATNELWERDAEAAEKKILIRYKNHHTNKFVFRIKMLKYGNDYKNKRFYKFKACRQFQRDLAKRILDEDQKKFDAYQLY